MSWLRSPIESELSRHGHYQSIRLEYPETCDWLLKEGKVNYWMDLDTPPYSMLWLQGAKGAGKLRSVSIL
jgi:hypothetical protein